MQRPIGVIAVATLALAQAVLGVLRALEWFRVGSDLMGRGVLILPMVGVVAYARGVLVAIIALLYALFAVGIFRGRYWARPLGFIAVAVTLLLAVSVIVQGEFVGRALFWLIVPAVVVGYLLSAQGRQVLKG